MPSKAPKRKHDDANLGQESQPQPKKHASVKAGPEIIDDQFRSGLFDEKTLYQLTLQYASSEPYKHGVIQSLVADHLLRSVRKEIQENLSFTPKETDIYKIHQTGDLANLDGLDDSSLSRLPSLLRLRNALYSDLFRSYLSKVTNAGPLSGKKTDMAINVYTPGCHLLCHDDVIGSRRVSYILYLTDPENPWKGEWGGALRLYPTIEVKTETGEKVKTPSPESSVSIPPAFNQLSFFAVQPGESYHDVEEVYAAIRGDTEDAKSTDQGRVRMAISGWYHIPQEGEDGYEPGLEAKLAEKSSLVQLQGKADELDLPQSQIRLYEGAMDPGVEADDDEELFTAPELEFLLQYISPDYLIPETLGNLYDLFADGTPLMLSSFLSEGFAARLKQSLDIDSPRDWEIARPPHKHRYLYQQARPGERSPQTAIQELIEILFPSIAFKKWLQITTSLGIESYDILARRFRRGQDYTLATGFDDEASRLEVTLGISPSNGWHDEEEDEEDKEALESTPWKKENFPEGRKGGASTSKEPEDQNPFGGNDVYMAGDDEEDEEADAAQYKGNNADSDDAVLHNMPACWNRLSIVLRDAGVLRFVKYVSAAAPGDRWDITGVYGLADDGESEGDEDVDDEEDGESEEES